MTSRHQGPQKVDAMLESADALPQVALGWLREIVRADFPAGMLPDGSHADAGNLTNGGEPGGNDASLVERLEALGEELARAGSAGQVYQALVEQTERLVDGSTCLLFPPGAVVPLPDARVRCNLSLITLPERPCGVGVLLPEDASRAAGGRYTSLAPLFFGEGAVALAYARFAEDGLLLLVERRPERVFGAADWELLRALAAQATAALARLRLVTRIDILPG